MNLTELANKYGTDKSPSHKGLRPGHSYTPFYEKLFAGLDPEILLEIGVETGASLRMWRDYFPRVLVIGLDIDAKRMFAEERILTLCANAAAADPVKFPLKIDIVIDDGSHQIEDQCAAFRNFWPLVKEGGFYCIEDVQRDSRLPLIAAGFAIEEFDPNFPTGDDRVAARRK
jgi:cephalosporin hydroxylase